MAGAWQQSSFVRGTFVDFCVLRMLVRIASFMTAPTILREFIATGEAIPLIRGRILLDSDDRTQMLSFEF